MIMFINADPLVIRRAVVILILAALMRIDFIELPSDLLLPIAKDRIDIIGLILRLYFALLLYYAWSISRVALLTGVVELQKTVLDI